MGEDFIDLTKLGKNKEKKFIELDEEPGIVVRFFRLSEDIETKDIISSIKQGNVICLIDVSPVLEDPSTLRIFINKIRRISDDYAITMKLYGKNWLLVLPENVTFQVGDE